MFGCCNNRCRIRSCVPWCCVPCCPQPPVPVMPPFPPFPPIPPQTSYELGGVVFGVDGTPVSGINISYTVNGQPASAITNGNGAYTINVPANANVTISAIPGLGVNVTPAIYNITTVNGNIYGLDFTFSVI